MKIREPIHFDKRKQFWWSVILVKIVISFTTTTTTGLKTNWKSTADVQEEELNLRHLIMDLKDAITAMRDEIVDLRRDIVELRAEISYQRIDIVDLVKAFNDNRLERDNRAQTVAEPDAAELKETYSMKSHSWGLYDFVTLVSLEEAKEYLDNERQTDGNEVFDKMWQEAEKIFSKSNRKLLETVDYCRIALTAYTMTDYFVGPDKRQMHTAFNDECRKFTQITNPSKTDWIRFPYKGWISLLHHALSYVPASTSTTKSLAPTRCFFGVGYDPHFTHAQWEGQETISFNHFCSATINETVAIHFATFDGKGTVFKFDRIPAYALGIRNYSYFPGEHEVLVWPWSPFLINVDKPPIDQGRFVRVYMKSLSSPANWD